MIELRGITWDHVRGLGGVTAAASAFTTVRPDVRIDWTVRSLQAFADEPVDRLAGRFDLIVFDHPAIGYAVSRGCLVALDGRLDPAFLVDQRASSVGRSAESYEWEGRRWALAIDAAAQVASFRSDLLQKLGADIPRTWDDVVALAERAPSIGARIALPSIPVDAFLVFLALCRGFGDEPCSQPDVVVERDAGLRALHLLGRVSAASHPESIGWNPPAMLERMATTDELVYCPLAFGYSNYARAGFRANLVRFGAGPEGADGRPTGTLGGAGLALSSLRPNIEAALAYAQFVADPETQRTTYFEGGGQPAHRSAWTDPVVNASSSGFFADTLPALDAAYLRPRYDGILGLQEAGGEMIHACLNGGGDAGSVLDELDEGYRRSRLADERTEG
jgi:multiple sugar transport system substrate-binding protein